jgi:hypothetical protein
MVTDHLLNLDESKGDTTSMKNAIKESAATAFGGEDIWFKVILSV